MRVEVSLAGNETLRLPMWRMGACDTQRVPLCVTRLMAFREVLKEKKEYQMLLGDLIGSRVSLFFPDDSAEDGAYRKQIVQALFVLDDEGAGKLSATIPGDMFVPITNEITDKIEGNWGRNSLSGQMAKDIYHLCQVLRAESDIAEEQIPSDLSIADIEDEIVATFDRRKAIMAEISCKNSRHVATKKPKESGVVSIEELVDKKEKNTFSLTENGTIISTHGDLDFPITLPDIREALFLAQTQQQGEYAGASTYYDFENIIQIFDDFLQKRYDRRLSRHAFLDFYEDTGIRPLDTLVQIAHDLYGREERIKYLYGDYTKDIFRMLFKKLFFDLQKQFEQVFSKVHTYETKH